MSRDEVLRILGEHSAELHKRGVKRLALFGSVARGEAHANSDVDILVQFEEPPGFDRYMDLKFFLESVLHRRVDLVMDSALKPWARAVIEEEAVHYCTGTTFTKSSPNI